MSIKSWIAGPVIALGLLAVATAGWMIWQSQAGRRGAEAATGATLPLAEHAAALRGAQRAAAAFSGPLQAGELLGLRRRERLRDALAATAWHAAELRRLAEASAEAPEIRLLGLEIDSWRAGIGRALERGGAGVATGLADSARAVERLAERVAARLDRARRQSEEEHRAAHLRAGALATGLLAGGLLALGGIALSFARSLTGAMARLPRDLQAFVAGGSEGRLPGEARNDEFGVMARALRVFAQNMQSLSRSHAELERIALTDPLTGLPNRRGLYDFLTRIGSEGCWADAGTIAVLHVDLDHLKPINDTHGHEAGDVVLREAAGRMAMAVRDSDILARIGGDEFVIFAHGVTGTAGLERLARRVLRRFDAPIEFRGSSFDVTVSIGAVLGGRRGRVLDPKRLLLNADIALCQAKADGRNRLAIFTSAMARGVREQRELAAEIRAGVRRREFELWFQPVVDARTGAVRAIDLLPRWRHPQRGVLTPRAFMRAAEAQNLTETVAVPVIERTLRAVAAWRDAGIAVPPLQLGASRTLLLAPTIVDRLNRLLDACGLEPDLLSVRVAERCFSGRSADVLFGTLGRFSELGIGLIIDDFGVVDGCLGTVARRGTRGVKVATGRSAPLLGHSAEPGEARRDAVLRGLARLGETLGIAVTAKGVDSAEDVRRLAELGFAAMQGEAIAPAMEPDAARRWLMAASAPPRLVAV